MTIELIPASRVGMHSDHKVCVKVALGIECDQNHKYNADRFFNFVAYTPTYGKLHMGFEVFESEIAGTLIGGCWGEWRIYANMPLSAVHIGLESWKVGELK